MNDNSNIILIYEYAEQALKDVISSRTALNTQLAAVIGIDATLIRFSSGLPDRSLIIDLANVNIHLNCYSCLWLKILSYISLIISLAFALWGFRPQKGGVIILPEQLMERVLEVPEELYRESIIVKWNQSIKELGIIINRTGKLLNRAVVFLSISVILSAIDIILASLLE
ncbi:MAG: hypothetical protein F6K35_47025 [Okeania sp. SIO2H7]|nr:hypothetical protein [Okeania sp. SIO2H7]